MNDPDREPHDDGSGLRGWVVVIMAICVLWLAAMVAASYYGLEYKTPVRIENWRSVAPTP